MPIAIDGSRVPEFLSPLPCGGLPRFDDGSGFSYRCDDCGAVLGSIGMPSQCYYAWKHPAVFKEAVTSIGDDAPATEIIDEVKKLLVVNEAIDRLKGK